MTFDVINNQNPLIIENHIIKVDDGKLYIREKSTFHSLLNKITHLFPCFKNQSERSETVRNHLATFLDKPDEIKGYTAAQQANLYANLSYFSKRVIEKHNASWFAWICAFFWVTVAPFDTDKMNALGQSLKDRLTNAIANLQNKTNWTQDEIEASTQLHKEMQVLKTVALPDSEIFDLYQKLGTAIDALPKPDPKIVALDKVCEKLTKGFHYEALLTLKEETSEPLHPWIVEAQKFQTSLIQFDKNTIPNDEKSFFALRDSLLTRKEKLLSHHYEVFSNLLEMLQRKWRICQRGKSVIDKWLDIEKNLKLFRKDIESHILKTEQSVKELANVSKDSPLAKDIQEIAKRVTGIVEKRNVDVTNAIESLTSARDKLEKDIKDWKNHLEQEPKLLDQNQYYSCKEVDFLVKTMPDTPDMELLRTLNNLFVESYKNAGRAIQVFQAIWKIGHDAAENPQTVSADTLTAIANAYAPAPPYGDLIAEYIKISQAAVLKAVELRLSEIVKVLDAKQLAICDVPDEAKAQEELDTLGQLLQSVEGELDRYEKMSLPKASLTSAKAARHKIQELKVYLS